jgi:hypothetical protein
MPWTLSSPMNTPLKPVAMALAMALAAAAGGCLMQPEVAISVTTADGQKIQVPLNAAPPPTTDGVVSVDALQFAPWQLDADHKAKSLAFSFVIGFKPGSVPTYILIEDDTDAPLLKIYETDHPVALRNNLWGGLSRPFAPSDEHVNWILNLDNNVRIYRVTVKLKDGSTHVLLKPVFVPSSMKQFVRSHLELNSGPEAVPEVKP